jgi:cytochrome c oxidase cbb3-type subunit 3
MSDGMSWFVIILTTVNTVAAVWLLVWMRKRRSETDTTTDTTGHTWDGDLKEYNNPLPRWWLWLFILSVIFAVVYTVLYPGLGKHPGTLGWTQVNQWEAMQAKQEIEAQRILARFVDRDPAELSSDPSAIAIGRNLFANECAACHGSDGRGSTGFPNLTDADWLWGGEPELIQASITEGRAGIMAPWIDVIGKTGVSDAAAYVMSLSGRKAPEGNPVAGETHYKTYCVACHGENGQGNHALGAPNLTDNVWLHGGSFNSIRSVIEQGRQNQMPAQGDRLGDTRIRLLTAYVISMGETRVAQRTP